MCVHESMNQEKCRENSIVSIIFFNFSKMKVPIVFEQLMNENGRLLETR